jgi:hypothetical protein
MESPTANHRKIEDSLTTAAVLHIERNPEPKTARKAATKKQIIENRPAIFARRMTIFLNAISARTPIDNPIAEPIIPPSKPVWIPTEIPPNRGVVNDINVNKSVKVTFPEDASRSLSTISN